MEEIHVSLRCWCQRKVTKTTYFLHSVFLCIILIIEISFLFHLWTNRERGRCDKYESGSLAKWKTFLSTYRATLNNTMLTTHSAHDFPERGKTLEKTSEQTGILYLAAIHLVTLLQHKCTWYEEVTGRTMCHSYYSVFDWRKNTFQFLFKGKIC